jgi:putative DNA primase/helicase
MPVIVVTPGQLHRSEIECWQALQSAGLYRQGRMLVRPSVPGDPDRPTRAKLAPWTGPVVVPVTAHYLRAVLAAVARFQKPADGGVRPTDPPISLCLMLIERVDNSGLPELTGIIQHPTLRSDGSLLDQPGYDAATGLLFIPTAGMSWGVIPDRPTRDDAVAAIAALRRPLREFPFDDPEGTPTGTSEAVALSMLMTVPIRRTLRSSPGFAVTAPAPGTGKSLLVDVAGVLATGQPVPAMSHTDDEPEQRKRMGAALMECRPILSIDNIERPLRSEVLCSVLTQAVFAERLLGKSETMTLSTSVTVVCNGNNLIIGGDLNRRMVICRLDAKAARPDEVKHTFDVIEEVQRGRGALVAAALTVVRAFMVAGCPDVGVRPYGSFDQWSTWVRSALIWAGVADPCGGRAAMEASDPERDVAIGVLSAWYEEFTLNVPSKGATAADALKEAQRNETLRAALDAIPSRSGKATSHTIGNWIRRYRDRPYPCPLPGGDAFLAFKQSGVDRVTKSLEWSVVKVSSAGGRGDCGGQFPNPKDSRSKSLEGELTPAVPPVPRAVINYRLADSPDRWCTAIGETEEGLRQQFGDRLVEVRTP